MYKEKRPTCITVIGWAWIIIGGLMFFSGIMALFGSAMMSNFNPENQEQIPTIFRYFAIIAVVQMGVAIIGFVSGINFLKFKAWSRNVLEILTWIILLFIAGFGIFWEYGWISSTTGHAPGGFDIMGAFMGLVIIGIYGVPLGIMLKYLRGQKVKSAIIGAAEPDTSPDEKKLGTNPEIL